MAHALTKAVNATHILNMFPSPPQRFDDQAGQHARHHRADPMTTTPLGCSPSAAGRSLGWRLAGMLALACTCLAWPTLQAQPRYNKALTPLASTATADHAPALSPNKPQRIVSLNLCTDQILLQLVPKARIAGITYLSTDPHNTVLHAQSQGLPIVRGNAEEVMALRPDLVLVGTYTTRHTTAMLRRFGIPVVAIAGANSFEDVRSEMREVAKAVGEVAQGEALIQAFDARLAQLKALPSRPTVTSRYTAGGYSAGSHTMYDDIIRAAGHVNGATQAGVQGYRQLPLELLMLQAPALLIGNDHAPGSPTQANRMLSHPAIQGLNARNVTLSSKHTVCGGIWNLEAVEHLHQQASVRTDLVLQHPRSGG